jgi:hypothetical protein
MSTAALTADDLAFLARPLHGFVTVAAGPQPLQPRPGVLVQVPASRATTSRISSIAVSNTTTYETPIRSRKAS